MTAPSLRATGRAAAENELLAQLGLPPSAAPEDVDEIHQAVSEYLAAAPADIRGWAHAQAAALDAAYLQLTDPVGFSGSALRSPTRPPRVVPGGPATPPARRASLPAAPAPEENTDDEAFADEAKPDEAEPDEDDFEALYASVTPSAHRDMGPDARPRPKRTPLPGAVVVSANPAGSASNPWRRVVLGGVAVILLLAIAFAGYTLGGGGGSPSPSAGVADASPPAIDAAKVAALMQKLQANPNDTATLLDLADEYYAGGEYDTAATWLDKVLAIDPKNIQALLARGATSFNLGDLAAAQTTWNQVVAIEPNNVEVHYDLGFLYLNQASPDWAGVQREWNKVIALDPTSQLAKTVQSHLDSLAASSMLPATSPAASGAASPAASGAAGSPAASTAAGSPAASPAASTQP